MECCSSNLHLLQVLSGMLGDNEMRKCPESTIELWSYELYIYRSTNKTLDYMIKKIPNNSI